MRSLTQNQSKSKIKASNIITPSHKIQDEITEEEHTDYSNSDEMSSVKSNVKSERGVTNRPQTIQ